MTLNTYKQKRHFNKTPEPKGTVTTSKRRRLRFVVQKHDASHLHYDFRLELEGVLKSWAVPKGPSLNPQDKRLAMMVEDHPVSYMTFEGTIPKGNYGAGEVIVWDIGEYWVPEHENARDSEKLLLEGLKRGKLTLYLAGKKLHGEYSLVRFKFKNERNERQWILTKKADEHASKDDITQDARSVLSSRTLVGRKESLNKTLSAHISPMLATLTDKPFDDPNWLFEIKWDGYRALARVQNGSVDLYSRNGKDFTKKYPSITEALKHFDRNIIIDGEIVAIDKHGRATFQTLQNAESKSTELQYIIFDLLYFDGQSIMNKPLLERKALLKKILPTHPSLVYSEHIIKKGKAYFAAAVDNDLEGVIAKRIDSAYLPATRSQSWLKIKHHKTDEALIVGMTAHKGSRSSFGSLVLGQYDDDGMLQFIGHVGTGFTEATLASTYHLLKPLVTKQKTVFQKIPMNAPITWIKPELIAQVKFTERTKSGTLRHPVFLGLREDKSPTEIKKEQRVAHNQVRTTHLEKVYFPKQGLTKGDLVDYYKRIADTILPYLIDRPESLNRHPNGVDKKNFFQKNFTAETPPFVHTKMIYSESNKEDIRYLLCQNKETLIFMANLGCIEINPWNSRIQSLEYPDYMVIDLDPGNNTWRELITVAKTVKKVLDQSCEKSYVKTSGKTGLHIYIPLGATYDYEHVKTFAQLIAIMVHNELPEITSLERSPSKRKDKIYIDYLQNRYGQTLAAPYSVRPTPQATVSTPVTWNEVTTRLDPTKFTIRTIERRLKKVGDLWKDLLKDNVDLKKAIECLQQEIR